MIDYNWDIFQGLTGPAGGWPARDAPRHGRAGEKLQRLTRKQSSRKLLKTSKYALEEGVGETNSSLCINVAYTYTQMTI